MSHHAMAERNFSSGRLKPSGAICNVVEALMNAISHLYPLDATG